MRFSRFACVLFAAFFSVFQSFAFSSSDILSPAPGEWGNMQPLVISTDGECDVFYSLYGNDPLESGFIYEAPFIINRIGKIDIRVCAVDKSGKRSDFLISYSVTPTEADVDFRTKKFIDDISRSPIRKYAAGTDFVIPSSLVYSFEKNPARFYPGMTFSISPECALDRYVPCTVRLGDLAWHFVIHLSPSNDSFVPQSNLPFSISGDGKVSFNDKKFIYQIDDEFWGGKNSSLSLDRKNPHTIRWQSVEYKEGNPVYSYSLPPLVGIKSSVNSDGSVDLFPASRYFSGKEYSLGKSSVSRASSSLCSAPSGSLHLETLPGDRLSTVLPVGVYCDGFYIGDVTSDVILDPLPPLAAGDFSLDDVIFSREKAHIKISSGEGTTLYFALSEPFVFPDGFFSSGSFSLPDVDAGPFKPYTGEFDLEAVDGLATYYKVVSYALDKSGKRSGLSFYRVIIDENGFYAGKDFAGKYFAGKHFADQERELSDFSDIVSLVNGRKFTRVYLCDGFRMGEGVYEISSDCTIVGKGDVIELSGDSQIKIVSNADVSFENCIFKKTADSGSIFSVEDSSLTLSSSELIGIFEGEASLVSASGSDLNLKDTGLTVQSDKIASVLYANGSTVKAEDCRFTSSAPNVVNMTMDSSSLDVRGNSFTVIGRMGRNIELLGSRVSMEKNRFVTKLTGPSSSPVWKDMTSLVERDVENTEELY